PLYSRNKRSGGVRSPAEIKSAKVTPKSTRWDSPGFLRLILGFGGGVTRGIPGGPANLGDSMRKSSRRKDWAMSFGLSFEVFLRMSRIKPLSIVSSISRSTCFTLRPQATLRAYQQ